MTEVKKEINDIVQQMNSLAFNMFLEEREEEKAEIDDKIRRLFNGETIILKHKDDDDITD